MLGNPLPQKSGNGSISVPEVYTREINAVLPRVLALFDVDAISATRGFGDRLYWSWKLIDYANATPQGMVHGLALLAASNRLPWKIDLASIIARIDTAIEAAGKQRASDGSLVEAFPNEKSFCVTALVAFDILCATDALESHIAMATQAKWRSIVAPMIAFLMKYDETHAIISNHLATAAAALSRWAELGDAAAARRASEIVATILQHQSDEGWFMEYDGADPGYETLGLSYLADIHQRRPSAVLGSAIGRSLQFLAYAAHPDGSFGGLYGSRNTRFIYPAGLEILAGSFPAAAALADFARSSIETRAVPTLSTMDDSNLAPMFNAYCRALCVPTATISRSSATLPSYSSESWRKTLPESGLIIDNGPEHYTVVSTMKGGVVYHFRKDQPVKFLVDSGVAAEIGGRMFTTQAADRSNNVDLTGDKLVIESNFVAAISERQTPFKMIVLRLLCLSLFRSRALLEIVKRMLVRRLITDRRAAPLRNRRTIALGAGLSIDDDISGTVSFKRISASRPFKAIHMASSGYWQIGDDTK